MTMSEMDHTFLAFGRLWRSGNCNSLCPCAMTWMSSEMLGFELASSSDHLSGSSRSVIAVTQRIEIEPLFEFSRVDFLEPRDNS
jgi:hypothetical protein